MPVGLMSDGSRSTLEIADEVCRKIIHRELVYTHELEKNRYQENLAKSITAYQEAKGFDTPQLIPSAVEVIKQYNICLKERLLEVSFEAIKSLGQKNFQKSYQKLEKELEELKRTHKEEMDKKQARYEELLEQYGTMKGKFDHCAEELNRILNASKPTK